MADIFIVFMFLLCFFMHIYPGGCYTLLVLACMVHACAFLALLLCLAWVFPSATVVFILALSFPHSHGVMGFLLLG